MNASASGQAAMTDGVDRAARIAALRYDYAAREKETVSSCNLCGSSHQVEVARLDRYGYPTTLRICGRCGLGFISPRLTEREYAHFYGSVYRPLVSAYHGRTIDATTLQVEQREYGRGIVEFLRHSLSAAPSSVIDIGGSTGVVAGTISDAFGSRATVLDPAPDELAVAEAAGIETIAGFAEEYDPGTRTWDLALLCQTIDHLLDVSLTLASIRRMMAPGGHAYIDIVDLNFMLRRCGEIEGVVKVDHPYYLTRDTARAYFDKAGLNVATERLSEDGHWGFLLRSGESSDPNWLALGSAADRLLRDIWLRRASTG